MPRAAHAATLKPDQFFRGASYKIASHPNAERSCAGPTVSNITDRGLLASAAATGYVQNGLASTSLLKFSPNAERNNDGEIQKIISIPESPLVNTPRETTERQTQNNCGVSSSDRALDAQT